MQLKKMATSMRSCSAPEVAATVDAPRLGPSAWYMVEPSRTATGHRSLRRCVLLTVGQPLMKLLAKDLPFVMSVVLLAFPPKLRV